MTQPIRYRSPDSPEMTVRDSEDAALEVIARHVSTVVMTGRGLAHHRYGD